MKKIEEITFNGEKIFIRKSFGGWKIVYPYQKEYNNGKINWKYLIAGKSWWNLLIIAIIVGLILGCVFEYASVVRTANECLANQITINPF